VPASVDFLRVGAGLVADASTLGSWLLGSYGSLLVRRIGLAPGGSDGAGMADGAPDASAEAHAAAVRACLAEVAARLCKLLPTARVAICAELEARCVRGLAAVRGISAAYRFQARGLPTQPSAFMQSALEPIARFSGSHALGMPRAEQQVRSARLRPSPGCLAPLRSCGGYASLCARPPLATAFRAAVP
jgi:hypothetical protein